MINFEKLPVDEVRERYFCIPHLFEQQKGGREEVLIGLESTPCFTVHRLVITDEFIKRSRSFYVGIVTNGEGFVKTRNEQQLLKQGDRFFVPYSQKEVTFTSADKLEIVLIFPPE